MAFSAPTGAANVTSAAVNAGTSITLTKPSGIANGDVLVAGIWARANTVAFPTVPTGWNAVGPSGTEITSVGILRWYWKPIPSAAAETAPDYTWSGGASGRNTGVLFRLIGADSATFVDVSGAEATALNTGTTPTLDLPAIAPTRTRGMLLSMTGAAITTGGVRGAFTPPASATRIGTAGTTTGASESDLAVDVESLTAAGNTGVRSYSRGTNAISSGIGFMLAVINGSPAPAATVGYASLSASTGWTPTGGTAVAVLGDTDGSTLLTATAPSGLHLTGTLGALTPPTPGTNVTLTLTVDKIGATTGSVTAQLLEGATVRSTQTVSAIPNGTAGTAVSGTVTVTFPAADVAAVTNWDALTLDLSVTAA